MVVAGRVTLSLRVQVTRITTTDLPRLRSLQSRVAATLALLAVRKADEIIDALVTYVQDMARAPGPLDNLERFLSFAMKLARMSESDAPRFRRKLEEVGMVNVITEMKQEAKAEGKAEAAQGVIDAIRRLVGEGMLPVSAAHTEIRELIKSGIIPREMGQAALKEIAPQ